MEKIPRMLWWAFYALNIAFPRNIATGKGGGVHGSGLRDRFCKKLKFIEFFLLEDKVAINYENRFISIDPKSQIFTWLFWSTNHSAMRIDFSRFVDRLWLDAGSARCEDEWNSSVAMPLSKWQQRRVSSPQSSLVFSLISFSIFHLIDCVKWRAFFSNANLSI